MAKEISEVKVNLTPDGTGKSYGKLFMQYKVSSSDNPELSTWKEVEVTLSGADLTNAQGLFTAMVSEAESLEGIV